MAGMQGSQGHHPYVLDLADVSLDDVALVGGKAARLGELMRLDGMRVPPGFCVTTAARRAADRADAVPADVAGAITAAVARLGGGTTFAVRSSATAEDAPSASFAGQHQSYLHVAPDDVVEHVRRCWASMSTEHAAAYRASRHIDRIEMAVVVQQMVGADVAGVMFTADPVTGRRTVVSIEAVRGLGDELMSGRAEPDVYTVCDGVVTVGRIIAADGLRLLTDAELRTLADLGRRIEARFGCPQDVEWCLAGGVVHLVQSRPITTLFPLPASAGDGQPHVFVSVGHGQMMTDPMRPLGRSLFQLTALPPMHEAGSRLWVDVTQALASPTARVGLLDVFGRSDPLIADALRTIVDRGNFLPVLPAGAPGPPPRPAGPELDADPAVVAQLVERTEASVAVLRREIAGRTGEELLDFVLQDIQELKRLLFEPTSHAAVMAGIEATWWLDDHLREWLGETGASDVLTRAAPGNITSEMGLALLDVADAIRPHPEVVALLREARDDGFLAAIAAVPGGTDAAAAIERFLERYGMRCVGEIDITRPRWSEHPLALVPLVLANIDHFGQGEAIRRVERGRRDAAAREQELLARLRELPDGESKAAEAARMIARLRTFIGYREHPKYGLICRYFAYKQALVGEAERLVQAGALHQPDDAFYLTFDELRDVVRTARADHELIRRRRAEVESHATLTPPRVLTSEGEAVVGSYHRDDLPSGTLVGLGVSSGVVEGRARVVHDMADADVGPGDILVTAHTDPSWSPLFVVVSGVVTEVGGLLTHGAVIAREYGLPAVVGVQGATRLIRDGQRIRVDGSNGWVVVDP